MVTLTLKIILKKVLQKGSKYFRETPPDIIGVVVQVIICVSILLLCNKKSQRLLHR